VPKIIAAGGAERMAERQWRPPLTLIFALSMSEGLGM